MSLLVASNHEAHTFFGVIKHLLNRGKWLTNTNVVVIVDLTNSPISGEKSAKCITVLAASTRTKAALSHDNRTNELLLGKRETLRVTQYAS